MRARRPIIPAVAFAAALVATQDVLADGKFFRQLQVQDAPDIRGQRAVVAFRDGVETLIVQSDVAGAGDQFAWVLPLPAEPTRIEACPSYTLTALNAVIQPRLTGPPLETLTATVILFLLIAGFCLDHLHARPRSPLRFSALRIVVVILASILLGIMMLPTLGRTGSSPEVQILQTARVGVYDISVIQGSDAGAVVNWLTSNGFATSPSASAVMRDYVSDGWCFLAAKIAGAAGSDATHHPLKLVFPIAEPVYPLRLTGTDGNPVQLDVYVIADQRARARHLRIWSSDHFLPQERYRRFADFRADLPDIYRAVSARGQVGIPAVTSVMWPGCVITRLHGRLRPADMRADLTFAWDQEMPSRATVYTLAGALGWSSVSGLFAAIIAMVAFTVLAARRRWTWRELLERRAVAVVLVAAVAGAARYATLDVVRATQSRNTGRIAHIAHAAALRNFAQASPREPFPDAYRALLASPQYGQPIAYTGYLESPGDFVIDSASNGWLLTILDAQYISVSVPISSNGMPQTAQ